MDFLKPCVFQPGEIIVEQGDVADSFFIITKGVCIVRRKTLVNVVHGQVIGRLSTYDHFGEGALITATRLHYCLSSGISSKPQVQKRNATIVAEGTV